MAARPSNSTANAPMAKAVVSTELISDRIDVSSSAYPVKLAIKSRSIASARPAADWAHRTAARRKVGRGETLRPSSDRHRVACWRLLLELQAMERGVAAALAQQLVVPAGFDDQPAIDHENAIGVHDGREA